MPTNHKGSEFNNISETWDRNEQKRTENNAANPERMLTDDTTADNALERIVKEESTEYDNQNKGEQLLTGERATLDDATSADDSEE